MIDVKLNDIVNSLETFQELMTISLPSKVSYKIARLIREISKENNIWEETRISIIQKYGNKDENGKLILNDKNQWTVPNEFIDDFSKEINEVLDTSIQINADKILLTDLDCQLSPTQMINLLPFIEE